MNFNFFNILKILIKDFFDLLYKRKCINCKCSINEGILCKKCLKTVQNLPNFEQGYIEGFKAYSAFYYEGAVKNLILELKFRHNKPCAYYAAQFLEDYINSLIENKNNDLNLENAVIIPIPTHRKNFNKRGYNNVLEIAKKLSELTGIKLLENVLIKKEFREPQYKLKANKRKNNPKNSFKLNDFKQEGLIILLDDILTTGATLSAAIELFKEKGVNNLICLTLAKTRFKKK